MARQIIPKLPFPRYERKGKCLRCGWCCLQEDPPCPYLVFDKANIAKCMIYNSKDRPSKCGYFPGNPPIVYEKCGYYFIDKWENKIVKTVVN